MYLAGVFVHRVENIAEALWGSRVSLSTISNLNKKAYGNIETWRNRPLPSDQYPYVFINGIHLKHSWGDAFENVAILVAIAVNQDGYREIIGVAEGLKEDKESWRSFLHSLRSRGLKGVQLMIGDTCQTMCDSVTEVFPEAKYQCCNVHFFRNIFSVVPRKDGKEVSRVLKAIHAQEDKEAALEKAKRVVEKLRAMKLNKATDKPLDGIAETLTYMDFPEEHWKKIRRNNVIERLTREIRRRTRVVGTFPDGASTLMMVCARLRHVVSTKWGSKKYMDMKHLYDFDANTLLD